METTLAPKISQTNQTTRAPHFPSSSCSSTPISGGSFAAKQTCEPSRSSSPSPLHTTPRILSPSLSPSWKHSSALGFRWRSALSSPGMRATGNGRPQLARGRPQLHRAHPRFQGSHGTRPLHRPLGLPALGWSDGRGCGQVRQDLQSQAHARQNAPSLSPLLQPPPATRPRRGHDSHQEPPRHQAVHTRQSRSDGASRASCCARPRRATFSTQKSTRAGSGTATGPSSGQLAVLSAVSWRTRRSPTRTTCCSWTAFTTPSRSSTCWRTSWESWPRAPSCQAASTTIRNSAGGWPNVADTNSGAGELCVPSPGRTASPSTSWATTTTRGERPLWTGVGGPARAVDRATDCGGQHQLS